MSVRVNLRLPDELWAEAKARGERDRATATEVVKKSLGLYLGIPIDTDDRMPKDKLAVVGPPKEGEPQVQVAKVEPARPMPNGLQLSTRTGMPRVVCQRMIDEGRVSVGADGRWLLDGNSV